MRKNTVRFLLYYGSGLIAGGAIVELGLSSLWLVIPILIAFSFIDFWNERRGD